MNTEVLFALLVLIVFLALFLYQVSRLRSTLLAVIGQSELDANRLRRAIKSLVRSLPHGHCHECLREERARTATDREAERRRQGITLVSVVCPVCQAQWDAEVDSKGKIGRMMLNTPGRICLEDNYETHQGPLYAAVRAQYASVSERK